MKSRATHPTRLEVLGLVRNEELVRFAEGCVLRPQPHLSMPPRE